MPGYRFGKRPPKIDYRTLRLKDYAANLPDPPPAANVLQEVYKNLNIQPPDASTPATLFPLDGNDTLGDCTIAGVAHAMTVYHSFVQAPPAPLIPPSQQVVKLYLQLTGGVDSGLDELTVLNYWNNNGIFGDDPILAYVSIDPKNHTHIRQAISLLNGVYLGFHVQKNCVQEFDEHQPWTPGRLTTDGHAVFAVAYDPETVTVLTWGNTQQGTWAWWDECVDEAYAILPSEAAVAKYAPGLDLEALKADLAAVAN
jgi:hypothetical protein